MATVDTGHRVALRHYAQAETLLELARDETRSGGDTAKASALARMAQVHAMLADTAFAHVSESYDR